MSNAVEPTTKSDISDVEAIGGEHVPVPILVSRTDLSVVARDLAVNVGARDAVLFEQHEQARHAAERGQDRAIEQRKRDPAVRMAAASETPARCCAPCSANR